MLVTGLVRIGLSAVFGVVIVGSSTWKPLDAYGATQVPNATAGEFSHSQDIRQAGVLDYKQSAPVDEDGPAVSAEPSRVEADVLPGAGAAVPEHMIRPFALGSTTSATALRSPDSYEGILRRNPGHGIIAFYGTRMSAGATPQEAADLWLTEFGEELGGPDLDLRLLRYNLVHEDRLTVFAYMQWIDDMPAENTILRLVVLNGDPCHVVFVGAQLAGVPFSGPRSSQNDSNAALANVKWLPDCADLNTDSEPNMAVSRFLEVNDPAQAAWAPQLTEQTDDRLASTRNISFADSAGGVSKAGREEMLVASVSGTVTGNVTPGVLPDTDYNPPVPMSLPDVTVYVMEDGGSNVTNAKGDYTISYDSPLATVYAQLSGPWAWVMTDQGSDLVVQQTVDPPGGTADLFFNPVPTGLTTAQVSAFYYTNLAHDFYKTRQPDYNGLDGPFYCYVNADEVGTCSSAYYPCSQVAVFGPGNDGCANSAYSSLIAWMYGHYTRDRLGIVDTDAFSHGFADLFAYLLLDDPVMGRDFRGPGNHIHDVRTSREQYPCGGTFYECSELLSGAWWDIRVALDASLGDPDGLETARQLFTDWSQISIGGIGLNSAHPLTLIEVLVADDDDGELLNGTPHACEIVKGFSLHGIEVYDVLFDCNGNGTVDACDQNDCNHNDVGDACDVLAGT